MEIEVAKSSAYERDREGAQYPNEGWGYLREENGTSKISCVTSLLQKRKEEHIITLNIHDIVVHDQAVCVRCASRIIPPNRPGPGDRLV